MNKATPQNPAEYIPESADTLDVVAASTMLFCSPGTVLELAECGELPGCKIGVGWVFLRDELKYYLWQQTKAQQADRRVKSGLDKKLAAGIVHETRRQRRAPGEAKKIVGDFLDSPKPPG